MKKLFHILLTGLAFSGMCCSCGSSDDKLEYTELGDNLDFGKGTYRPNPFKILDDIPPFSWMGMPDSVKKTTELAVSFNEDAMRSKSTAQLAIVDLNGNKIEGIQVNKPNGDIFSINADTAEFIIPVSFTVNPSIGDSILKGSIMVLGVDLDEANRIPLGTTMTPVATWSLEHKTGINWLRWILLIIIVGVALYILFVIGCLIYGAFSVGIEALSSMSFTLIGFNLKTYRKKLERKTKKHKVHNSNKSNDNRNLKILKQKAPEFVKLVMALDAADGNLTLKNLRVRRLLFGGIEISYSNSIPGKYTKVKVKGKNIFGMAGSLPGECSAQNQFFNKGQILSNKKYHVDNVASYETDKFGRVIKATANRTQMYKIGARAGRDKSTQYQVTGGLPGYDGGHLFDCGTGGANEAINQVPMESSFNQNGKWRQMEINESRITKTVKDFKVIRQIKYSGSSPIPDRFISTYYINGKKSETITLINPHP